MGKLIVVNIISEVEGLIIILWYNIWMVQLEETTTEKKDCKVKEKGEGTTHPRELLTKNNNTPSQRILWNQLQANSQRNLHEDLLQPGGEKWGLSNLAQLWITSKD